MGRLRYLLVVAAVAAVPIALACEPQTSTSRPATASVGDAAAGRRLIGQEGCGACHEIPGVDGATGLVGPPLERMGERSYIAGELANTQPNMIRWLMDPQAVEPGTAMPDLGITEAQAEDISAYLASLR